MVYDIIIVGGGPAGLTAAVYARRADKSVLVIEKGAFGGQITFSPKVENIPGFASVTGNEFAEKLVEQALGQGADVEACEVLNIRSGEIKQVETDDGVFEGRTVILAAGARHRMLGLPDEEKYIGNGISFCAVCDGAFYQNGVVGVVGGGNSALQEALLLAETSAKVCIFQNLDFLTGEAALCEQVKAADNIEVYLGCTVAGYTGNEELDGVVIRKESDGSETAVKLDGLFIAIGLVPQNEPAASVIELDERGYAVSGEDCLTRDPGIFAAGDCRTKQIRQVTTAAADGAVAALAACRYLDSLR